MHATRVATSAAMQAAKCFSSSFNAQTRGAAANHNLNVNRLTQSSIKRGYNPSSPRSPDSSKICIIQTQGASASAALLQAPPSPSPPRQSFSFASFAGGIQPPHSIPHSPSVLRQSSQRFSHSNASPGAATLFSVSACPSSNPHSPQSQRRISTMAVAAKTATIEETAMDATQLRLMHDDECILVNEDDEVVGHASKLHCHWMENIDAGTALHRAFSVFLFNHKNELLLQRRSATKVTFPLVWTNTCCSHPLYTPSELDPLDNLGVRTAAQRKLEDELGIPAAEAPVDGFTILGRILYKATSNGKWGEHEVDYILFMRGEPTLALNPEEVAEVQFVDRQFLRELVAKADKGEDGIVLSPWFRLCVDRFLFSWWDKLDAGTLREAIDLDTIHKL